jgi:hypothetical protein
MSWGKFGCWQPSVGHYFSQQSHLLSSQGMMKKGDDVAVDDDDDAVRTSVSQMISPAY